MIKVMRLAEGVKILSGASVKKEDSEPETETVTETLTPPTEEN